MKKISESIDSITKLQAQFPSVSVGVTLSRILIDCENFDQLKKFKSALVELLLAEGVSGTHVKSRGRFFWAMPYGYRCGINIKVDAETEFKILTGGDQSWLVK